MTPAHDPTTLACQHRELNEAFATILDAALMTDSPSTYGILLNARSFLSRQLDEAYKQYRRKKA